MDNDRGAVESTRVDIITTSDNGTIKTGQLYKLHNPTTNPTTPGLYHPSWDEPCKADGDEYESPEKYRFGRCGHAHNRGSFCFVHLGDTFGHTAAPDTHTHTHTPEVEGPLPYTVIHKLGAGGFATVWLARDAVHQRLVTLKIMAAEVAEPRLKDEVRILSYIASHPDPNPSRSFINPLLDHFTIHRPTGTHLCLVLPLAGGRATDCIWAMEQNHGAGELRHRIVGQEYGGQLAQAVAYLHHIGIVHGDLTASNVLVGLDTTAIDNCSLDELYRLIGPPRRVRPRGWRLGSEYLVDAADISNLVRYSIPQIRIIDFGEAFFISHPPQQAPGIPIPYCPPEILFFNEACVASDIWSLGCLLFELWAGEQLWDNQGVNLAIYQWVRSLGKLPQVYWDHWEKRLEYVNEHGLCVIPSDPDNDVGEVREGIAANITDTLDTLRHIRPAAADTAAQHNRQHLSSDLLFAPTTYHPATSVTYSTCRKTALHPAIQGQGEHNALLICPVEEVQNIRSQNPSLNFQALNLDAEQHQDPERFIWLATTLRSFVQTTPPLPSDLQLLEDLLLKIFKYHPNERIPALLISQHPWLKPDKLSAVGHAPAVAYQNAMSRLPEKIIDRMGLPIYFAGIDNINDVYGVDDKCSNNKDCWWPIFDKTTGTWDYWRGTKKVRVS